MRKITTICVTAIWVLRSSVRLHAVHANAELKYWVFVFSIRIWYLAYPTDRSNVTKKSQKTLYKHTFLFL